MNILKKAKGITLIALVITIIILLILAGISISSLTNNGLFGKTEEADRKTDIAQIKEEIKLDIFEKQLQNLGTISYGELKSILDERGIVNYEENGITIKGITTEKGYKIPMSEIYTGEITSIPKTTLEYAECAKPSGATITETDETKGIVMVDGYQNEWVWVEVPKETVFTTSQNSTNYDNIKADLIKYARDYREGSQGQGEFWNDEWYDYCGTTYDGTNQYSQVKYITDSSTFTKAKNYYGTIYTDAGTTEATEYVEGTTYYVDITEKLTDTSGCGLTFNEYQINYQKMLSSVYTNGGFWISRYEIGDATSTKSNTTRTTSSEITGTAVSKADQIPYNFVTCSQAQTLSSGMSTNTNKTSSLLFGIQWDLTCKFLEKKSDLEKRDIYYNSESWGNNYNKSLTLDRGKYNINAINSTSVWTPYTTNSRYVTNKQKSSYAGVLLTTGASEKVNKMNIYDFAGNLYEYTLEHATSSDLPTNPCAFRNLSYAVSHRTANPTKDERYNLGFRTTLY